MKHVLKELLPSPLRNRVRQCRCFLRNLRRLSVNYLYDFRCFQRAATYPGAEKMHLENLAALITMDYHRLEKGLALRDARPGFGANVIDRLDANLRRYVALNGPDRLVAITAEALREHRSFNTTAGASSPKSEALIAWIDSLCFPIECVESRQGGTLMVTKQEIHRGGQGDFGRFMGSRYSVRHFTSDAVPATILRQAIDIARRTPSVCNRQAWRVHLFQEPAQLEGVLKLQNGNAGFRHLVPAVLIVTSDMRVFTEPNERNQAWIDGGMFAMSLVNGLHYLGLGSCCLNWSVDASVDRALKRLTGIPPHEAVIMMVAAGHLPNELKVAQSPRKGVGEILTIHKSGETLA